MLGSRGKVAAAAVLIAGGFGALALVRSTRSRSAEPPPPAFNHGRLMESMIAHARSSGDAAPGSIISGLTRGLKVGSPAPDFRLPPVEGGEDVSLSGFRGRPVVLVFGSFSCIVFYERIAEIERLHRAYKDEAAFLFVNVTEAGHRIPGLEYVIDPPGPDVPDPLGDRRRRVARALRQTHLSLTGVLDTEQAAEVAYDAYPTRVVVVGADGRIALDVGRGMSLTQTWDLSQVEEWLKGRPGVDGEAGGPSIHGARRRGPRGS